MGDAMTLLGGFFYALHIVMVAKLARDKDPVLVSILQFGSAAAAAWVVTLVFESRPQAAVSYTHLTLPTT